MLLRDARGVVDLAMVLQQLPPSQVPFQAYANYTMVPPQVSFIFRAELPTDFFIYVGGHNCVCFLFSGSHVDAFFTSGGSTVWVCTTAALGSLSVASIFVCW